MFYDICSLSGKFRIANIEAETPQLAIPIANEQIGVELEWHNIYTREEPAKEITERPGYVENKTGVISTYITLSRKHGKLYMYESHTPVETHETHPNRYRNILRKRSFSLSFSTRATKMGAYDRTLLFSIRQRRRLVPHCVSSSRTGNHGTNYYSLYPGKYFCLQTSISNSGKGGSSLTVMRVDHEGQVHHAPVKNIPEWLYPLLPSLVVAEISPEPEF